MTVLTYENDLQTFFFIMEINVGRQVKGFLMKNGISADSSDPS